MSLKYILNSKGPSMDPWGTSTVIRAESATILRRQFSGDNSPAAILRWTILRRAILRWTILRWTILRRSVLRWTILRWTILRQTIWTRFSIFAYNFLTTNASSYTSPPTHPYTPTENTLPVTRKFTFSS